MTNADLMVLTYPVIGAAAVSAAAFGLIYLFGYHKASAPRGAATVPGRSRDEPEQSGQRTVDGVFLRLTEAEVGRLVADHAHDPQPRPVKSSR
jgi:hypothetical protein